MLELIKYKNRKFYSKELGVYVTITSLQGKPFKVTCHETGRDLTDITVASIEYQAALKKSKE